MQGEEGSVRAVSEIREWGDASKMALRKVSEKSGIVSGTADFAFLLRESSLDPKGGC